MARMVVLVRLYRVTPRGCRDVSSLRCGTLACRVRERETKHKTCRGGRSLCKPHQVHRMVHVCSHCTMQMNPFRKPVAGKCGLCRWENNPRSTYDESSVRKAWQCPRCGWMHCNRCCREHMAVGVVPRIDGLGEYDGPRQPHWGPTTGAVPSTRAHSESRAG